MRLGDLLKVFSLNPMWRLVRHAEYLEKHVKIAHVVDRRSWKHVRDAFDKTARKLRVYYVVRTSLFVVLYLSAVGAVFRQMMPWLVPFLAPIEALSAVLGVGILTLLVLGMQRIIGAVLEDLRIEHAHLVALAVKHNDGFIVHPEERYGLYTQYLKALRPRTKRV